MKLRVLFRCDSSRQIGTGHVQRCLTLADDLVEKGAEVFFACLELEGHIAHRVRERGFGLFLESSNETELYKQISKAPSWDWVIFDHYGLDAEAESLYRRHSRKIMAIDDLADRPHDVDLLVDTNDHGDNSEPYKNFVSSKAHVFLGPKYALLRKEFREARSRIRSRGVERGLIFFGGTDPLQLLPVYYNFLLENPWALKGRKFDFITSSDSSSLEELRSLPSHSSLEISVQPPMAEKMLAADFYVGSGGTVTWERMHLGLTGLVIAVADNQVPNAENLHARGCHLYLGESDVVLPEKAMKQLIDSLSRPQDIQAMSRRCLDLSDGSGQGEIVRMIFKS